MSYLRAELSRQQDVHDSWELARRLHQTDFLPGWAFGSNVGIIHIIPLGMIFIRVMHTFEIFRFNLGKSQFSFALRWLPLSVSYSSGKVLSSQGKFGLSGDGVLCSTSVLRIHFRLGNKFKFTQTTSKWIHDEFGLELMLCEISSTFVNPLEQRRKLKSMS